MAGHTRGAYAARTATMQGSKEIDDKGLMSASIRTAKRMIFVLKVNRAYMGA